MSNRVSKIVHLENLEWAPLIKGCDLASVDGDPNAEGAPFVLRLRCGDGAKIPAHWHPTDENITVLKGTLLVGGRDDRADSRRGAFPGELGEPVRSPAARRSAPSSGETRLVIRAGGRKLPNFRQGRKGEMS